MNYNLSEDSTVEDVKNILIAIGVNGCSNSYDSNHRNLRDTFCKLPLNEIAPMWNYLVDSIKISIVNQHIDEFREWINSK